MLMNSHSVTWKMITRDFLKTQVCFWEQFTEISLKNIEKGL